MLQLRHPSKWAAILTECGVQMNTASKWAEAFSKELYGNALSAGEAELDDFLGQILHESAMLERTVESLNYKVDALLSLFGRTKRITTAQAMRLGRIDGRQMANQQEIANIVYGGEWGLKHLGNTEYGDGWKYRGRGPIQLTGRANYAAMQEASGFDLLDNPDQLATDPRAALRATILWWEKTLPDSLMGNLPAVTKRVNGGNVGLMERKRLTEAAARALAR